MIVVLLSTIFENESNGNDICATVTQGEHSFDTQDLSVVHNIVAQSLVEHFPILPLSQDDYLTVICDKEELCDSSLANSMPQLPHNHDTLNLTSEISAANKHVVQVASPNDEMKLLSSLDILGYIEFNGLCNLKNLEKKLFKNLELTCFLEIPLLLDNINVKENFWFNVFI